MPIPENPHQQMLLAQIEQTLVLYPDHVVIALHSDPNLTQNLEEGEKSFAVLHPATEVIPLFISLTRTQFSLKILLGRYRVDNNRPLEEYQGEIFQRYNLRWLTQGGSMDIVPYTEITNEGKIVVGFQKNVALKELTPAHIDAAIKLFCTYQERVANAVARQSPSSSY